MRVGKTRRDSEERRSAQEKTGLRIAPTAHLLPRYGENLATSHISKARCGPPSYLWRVRPGPPTVVEHVAYLPGTLNVVWKSHRDRGHPPKGPRLKPKFHQAAFRGLKAPAPSGKAKRKHGDNRRLGSELSQVRKSGPGAPSTWFGNLTETGATRQLARHTTRDGGYARASCQDTREPVWPIPPSRGRLVLCGIRRRSCAALDARRIGGLETGEVPALLL